MSKDNSANGESRVCRWSMKALWGACRRAMGFDKSKETKDLLSLVSMLKAQFDANPDEFLWTTVPLTKADYHLIGKLIQMYSFADLNARRIIDTLRHAALGHRARNGARLQDAQVLPKLREAAELLWDSNWKEGILRAADTIEMHRIHRHNFAHWAARRVAGHNALVLFTANAREVERRDGIPQENGELKYGIVPMDGIETELSKLEGHSRYLAEAAAHFERNFNELKDHFAQTK